MKKISEHIIRFLFSLFDRFFSKKFIVFSCRAAKGYSDNAKILYEKFLSEGESDIFFYTKKRSVLESIPKNSIYAYSLKGVYVLLRTRILIFTHGAADFQPYFPTKNGGRIFINLFHAIAVKKLATQISKKRQYYINLWDYFLVSSDFESQFIKKQFGLDQDQILVFGQPRNDTIIQNLSKSNDSDKQLALYAPTFRDNSLVELFPFKDVNLIKLDEFLEEKNLQIMIRLHINDELKYKSKFKYINLKNIFFTGSDKISSINDFLHNVNFLITDYSSISIDFLLLDRPIAYIPYDFDNYEKERGFSFDFLKHTAGPILDSQESLKSFLLNEEYDYSSKRRELKDLFHENQDGKSSEKLYQFIKQL